MWVQKRSRIPPSSSLANWRILLPGPLAARSSATSCSTAISWTTSNYYERSTFIYGRICNFSSRPTYTLWPRDRGLCDTFVRSSNPDIRRTTFTATILSVPSSGVSHQTTYLDTTLAHATVHLTSSHTRSPNVSSTHFAQALSRRSHRLPRSTSQFD